MVWRRTHVIPRREQSSKPTLDSPPYDTNPPDAPQTKKPLGPTGNWTTLRTGTPTAPPRPPRWPGIDSRAEQNASSIEKYNLTVGYAAGYTGNLISDSNYHGVIEYYRYKDIVGNGCAPIQLPNCYAEDIILYHIGVEINEEER